MFFSFFSPKVRRLGVEREDYNIANKIQFTHAHTPTDTQTTHTNCNDDEFNLQS